MRSRRGLCECSGWRVHRDNNLEARNRDAFLEDDIDQLQYSTSYSVLSLSDWSAVLAPMRAALFSHFGLPQYDPITRTFFEPQAEQRNRFLKSAIM